MNTLIPTNDKQAVHQNWTTYSDEMLVSAAKGGDVAAFNALCDRYSPRTLRKIYCITKDWEDAEDAHQDSFLKAFIHLNKFEGRSSFSSWVTRIAINMSLMIIRKKSAKRELSIDASENDCESYDRWELRDFREDPERRYARHERAELLRGAIRRLPPALRTAVELQQAQEYSVQELADSLGISLAAAKSRLLRARLSMRTQLHGNNVKSSQSGGIRSI